MSGDKKIPEKNPAHAPGGEEQANTPEWADGLRQLYDSVVDEPLPDSFKDLLAKLDESKGDDRDAGQGTDS